MLAQSDVVPDLILISDTLADVDPFYLCKNLKSAGQTSHIPAVFITNSNNATNQEKALEAGADEFIYKPLSPRLVRKRIRICLDRQHDIDTVSHIRHQIEESHYEQQQLLAAISSILIGLDQDNKITLWNRSAEQLFGLPSKDVRGESFDKLALDWTGPVMLSIDECRNNIQILHTDDISYLRNDGSQGILGFSLNPIMHKDNNRLGVVLVGADITDKKDMEKQLLHAQKMESIGQLAAGIAHEINTPIQFIGSNCSFLTEAFVEMTEMIESIKQLADTASDNTHTSEFPKKIIDTMEKADIDYLLDDIPEAISQSQEGISRVSKIVQAMKDFSHGSEEKTDADLNRAIESTITVAQSEWKHVAEMKTDLDQDLPPVPCLLSEFNQVILNMIVNACHAISDAVTGITAKPGVITITTKQVDDWAEIRVSDTGSGMTEEVSTRIFDPFFTTKEVGKGTGQGLSIAHSVITQKHNGSIAVESTPGEGTTFIIRLPLYSS